MKLGTIVQVVVIGLVALLFAFEMVGALLSSPCTLTRADEFVDPQTMFSSVCRVEMACDDGPWSGEMGTASGGWGSRRHRHPECGRVGDFVRRSPLWLAPRYDGPLDGFRWSWLGLMVAFVVVPAAGYWLNPREKFDPRELRR